MQVFYILKNAINYKLFLLYWIFFFYFSNSYFAEPITTIHGAPDLYIDTGSTVNLTCIVRHLPEPPAAIQWTHNNEVRVNTALCLFSIWKKHIFCPFTMLLFTTKLLLSHNFVVHYLICAHIIELTSRRPPVLRLPFCLCKKAKRYNIVFILQFRYLEKYSVLCSVWRNF